MHTFETSLIKICQTRIYDNNWWPTFSYNLKYMHWHFPLVIKECECLKILKEKNMIQKTCTKKTHGRKVGTVKTLSMDTASSKNMFSEVL